MIINESVQDAPGVYVIINKINNKCYYGSTKHFETRRKEHLRKLRKNQHGNQYLQNAYNKYGESNFEFIIVEILTSYDDKQILEIEQKYIDLNSDGYNISRVAGKPCRIWDDEAREKLKQDSKNRWKDEEYRKMNIDAAKKGLTPEVRQKMSDSHKGHKHSAETCEKIKQSNDTYWADAENIKKHSEKMKEVHTNPSTKEKHRVARIGRKLSDETCRKMSESMKNLYATTDIGQRILESLKKHYDKKRA